MTPTLQDLIERAAVDHDCITEFAFTKNLADADGLRIAATALQGAIEDWCWDNNQPTSAVSQAIRGAALTRLIDAGIDAREDLMMRRIAEDIASDVPRAPEYQPYHGGL